MATEMDEVLEVGPGGLRVSNGVHECIAGRFHGVPNHVDGSLAYLKGLLSVQWSARTGGNWRSSAGRRHTLMGCSICCQPTSVGRGPGSR